LTHNANVATLTSLKNWANWVTQQTKTEQGSLTMGYTVNEMSEYQRIGTAEQQHDHNGNRTDDGQKHYQFTTF